MPALPMWQYRFISLNIFKYICGKKQKNNKKQQQQQLIPVGSL